MVFKLSDALAADLALSERTGGAQDYDNVPGARLWGVPFHTTPDRRTHIAVRGTPVVARVTALAFTSHTNPPTHVMLEISEVTNDYKTVCCGVANLTPQQALALARALIACAGKCQQPGADSGTQEESTP